MQVKDNDKPCRSSGRDSKGWNMCKITWQHSDGNGNKIIRTEDGKFIILAAVLDYMPEYPAVSTEVEAVIYFTAFIRGVNAVQEKAMKKMETIFLAGANAFHNVFTANIEDICIKGICAQISEKGGLTRIYFEEKPAEDVRHFLKVAGFRWNTNTFTWDISSDIATIEDIKGYMSNF